MFSHLHQNKAAAAPKGLLAGGLATQVLAVILLSMIMVWTSGCESVQKDPLPAAPVAQLPDAYQNVTTTAAEGAPVSFSLIRSLNLGAGLSIRPLSLPTGTLSLDTATATYTWRTARTSSGTEVLRFQICNSQNDCRTADVVITHTITPPCVARFLSDTLNLTSIPLTGTVDLARNDNLCPGKTYTYTLTQPSSLVRITGSIATLTMPTNDYYNGPWSYTVEIKDSLGTVLAVTDINLIAPQCEDFAVANDDVISVAGRQSFSFPLANLAANDYACPNFWGTLPSIVVQTQQLDSLVGQVIVRYQGVVTPTVTVNIFNPLTRNYPLRYRITSANQLVFREANLILIP